jgi:pimeloyl-ACP methyl ester carboxylesterase
MHDEGIKEFALIGHSFGGAVVIQAASQAPDVRTVVAIAAQSYGTESVPELATRCSLLLLHGTGDLVLPPRCSQHIYRHALEPKRLILYPNAGHNLDEVADEVYQVIKEWIVGELNCPIATLY